MGALQEGAEQEQKQEGAATGRGWPGPAGLFETVSEHDGSAGSGAGAGAGGDAEVVLSAVLRPGEGAACQVLHRAPLCLHAHVLARTP